MFNSWEPRSNLGCEEMIHEFERDEQKRLRQTDEATANDPEVKRRRYDGVVDQLLAIDPQLTALRLIDLYDQLDASKVG